MGFGSLRILSVFTESVSRLRSRGCEDGGHGLLEGRSRLSVELSGEDLPLMTAAGIPFTGTACNGQGHPRDSPLAFRVRSRRKTARHHFWSPVTRGVFFPSQKSFAFRL